MEFSSTTNQLLASQDTPYSKLSFSEKYAIAKTITKAAIPNMFTSIGLLLKDVISMNFIGHLNDPSLFAAFGFGIAWCNGFAFAIIYSLAAGFGTIASQAYGAKNHRRLGLLYQKALVVIAMSLILIYALLWFAAPIMGIMGYNEALTDKVTTLINSLLINVLIYPLYEVIKFYLVAQNIFQVPAYVIMITSTIHIFWCHLFVNVLGLELVGSGIARTITDASSTALVMLYAKYYGPNPESWIPWTSECFQDLAKFAKDIISHGSSVYMEWITFEISVLITGFLNQMSVLAAHTATMNFLGLTFNISFGFTLSTGTLVANAVGEGSHQKAKSRTIVGLGLLACFGVVLGHSLFLLRGPISAFYTNEPGVQEIMQSILTLYYFGAIPDLLCNGSGFVLRSLGQEKYVLRAYIFSYYCIALVLAVITGLILSYSYYGIWSSLIIGFYVLTSICFYRLYTMDWEYEVLKVKNDMKTDEMNEMVNMRNYEDSKC